MKLHSSRREFIEAFLAAGCATAWPTTLSSLAAPQVKMIKGLVWGMLPENLSIAERFKLAAEAGFQAVEAYTADDPKTAEEIRKAADGNQVKITSVMNQDHWRYPLSSGDPEVVKKSLEGMKTSLRNAKLWGADAVLLVPAVVNAQTSYKDAWDRSSRNIRELIPIAEELKVTIAVEEVWNKFLLSPLEFAHYVDSFESPWVKAYFDVGNVVLFGYPQDWIRTLGHRIVKVHLKDFKMGEGWDPVTARFVNLGEGDVDWPEVRKALGEIRYHGPVTAELPAGDVAYLTDVRQRIDKLLLGV